MIPLTEKQILKNISERWSYDAETVRGFYKLYLILIEVEKITSSTSYGVRQGRKVLPTIKRLMKRKIKLHDALGLCDISRFKERSELTSMRNNF